MKSVMREVMKCEGDTALQKLCAYLIENKEELTTGDNGDLWISVDCDDGWESFLPFDEALGVIFDSDAACHYKVYDVWWDEFGIDYSEWDLKTNPEWYDGKGHLRITISDTTPRRKGNW